ncbi:hypothetical protein FDECE_15112 [Fusarium decemcellulare]|nr:hypothetical protein FDECE_15112 [Fusarium decemcellulare]
MPPTVAPRIEVISTLSSFESFSILFDNYGPLYIDLEGKDLSRHGTISIVSVFSPSANTVWLFDVEGLGSAAFTQPDALGFTLKEILQSSSRTKYFWDVRNDADALWAIYKVNLGGVIDVQLLENASRAGNKRYLSGLAKAIQYDASLGFVERERWVRVKREITDMMRHDVFSQRPLEKQTIQYCANDVVHLPRLVTIYNQRIKREWLSKALVESEKRVAEAHSPFYNPQSPTKVLGPWAEDIDLWPSSMENDPGEDGPAMFELSKIGFYDDDDDDTGGYESDFPNAHDGAFCSEALYSCWDNSF